MVQVARAPRAPTARGGGSRRRERSKHAVAHGGVGRERRASRTRTAPCDPGSVCAPCWLVEDRRPAGDAADGQLLRRARCRRSPASVQPGDRLLAAPHALSQASVRRCRATSRERREPRAPSGSWRRRRREAGAQHAPRARGARRVASAVGDEPPERRAVVGEHALHVQLVASRAAARAAPASMQRRAARRAVEQFVPAASPTRCRASARRRCRAASRAAHATAGGVELEVAVAEAAAVRQHEQRRRQSRAPRAPRRALADSRTGIDCVRRSA